MKKIKRMVLLLALVVCLCTQAIAAETNLTIMSVNGADVGFKTYTTYDANGGATTYVDIFEVAKSLAGTECQFNVNVYENGDLLLNGAPYAHSFINEPFTTTGTDYWSYCLIKLNNTNYSLNCYVIDGVRYFKLRDLGTLLGFNVEWENGKITISTSKQEEKQEEPVYTAPEKPKMPESQFHWWMTKQEVASIMGRIQDMLANYTPSTNYSENESNYDFTDDTTDDFDFSSDYEFNYVSIGEENALESALT